MKNVLVCMMLMLVAVLVTACAETRAQFNQHKRIIDPDTGLVVYEKTTDTGSFARAPDDAAGPTTQSVTEQGVTASVSGTHTKTAEQIIAGNQIVFYWAAVAFGVGAILAATLGKSLPIAVGFGVAAAASASTPTFLNELGPWPMLVGLIGVAGAFIWYMAKRHASNQSSKLAGQRYAEAERAIEQGKVVEALDLMRSARDAMLPNKPTLSRAFNK